MATRPTAPCSTVLLRLALASATTALLAGTGAELARAADGPVDTVAGTTPGFAGDGGPATQARLNGPRGVAVAPDGRILIADSANLRVRQVAPTGVITTIAAPTPTQQPTFGPPIPPGLSGAPVGVAYDAAGLPVLSDNGGDFVARVTGANNLLTIIAGTRDIAGFAGDGGPATAARLDAPTGLAAGPDGSVYIADTGNDRIRRVSPAGVITTFAGSGQSGFAGDAGPATEAALNGPRGVAVGLDGSVLIADTGNHRIRQVAPNGVITTVAGIGAAGFDGDGLPAASARVNAPTSVTPLRLGGFVFTDTGNDRIRRVTPLGTVFTIAGGARGLAGDTGPASTALFSQPESIVATPTGGFLLTDTGNSRIRSLASDGVLPGPIPGRTLRISRSSGFVKAVVAGRTGGSLPLREPDLVLLGTRANAEKGEVQVETGTMENGIRTATVSGGEFAIEQPAGPVETTFRLSSAMNGCRRGEGGPTSGDAAGSLGSPLRGAGRSRMARTNRTESRPTAFAAATKQAKRKRKRRSRKIFVRSDGGHRTTGRYADAVVRGTQWTIQDFCTNSRVTVREGSVAVTDRVQGRTVLVTAGNRYIARLRRP